MERIPTAAPGRAIQSATSSFATLLRTFRTTAELTQEELAERSGVSVRAISDLERGVKTRPQRATVDLLATGLGLTPQQRAEFGAAVPSRTRSSSQVAHALDLPVGGFLGSVPDRPLVARSTEIERIRELVESVRTGAGRLILLSGEPGVGKTRLAQEATLICRASGMHLVAGQCFEPQRRVAYFPFVGILTRLVPVVRSRISFDPLRRWPSLRRLVPVDPVSGDKPEVGDGDQQRLFWSVSGMMEALAATMPIVVALDDLHWADQSSLDLLFHLAHQLRDAPVLLLGTYRDIEVGQQHPLRHVIRNLYRERLLTEVPVGRLDSSDTAVLMSSMLEKQRVSPDFVDLVHGHTAGNAFFVQEIVRALIERGDAAQMDGVWRCRPLEELAIPNNVHDAISERLARLSDSTRQILGEASVLGDAFEFDDLQAMGDRSERDVEDALEEAARASVVRFGSQDTYAFYHALTQQVLYQDLTPRQRRRLHLAAGNAIEQQPESIRIQRAAELAWHFHRGGNRAKTMCFALIAGDQAEERFAHREAERHYRMAVDAARSVRDVAQEAVILERLGRVLTNYGRYEDAGDALQQARRLYREIDDPAGEVRTVVQLGSVHRAMGTSEIAIPLVHELLDRLDTGARPASVAELNIVLETLCYSTGRYQEGLAASDRAADLARAMGDTAALVRAETGRGTELMMLGDFRRGVAAMESALSTPGADDDPYNLVRLLENTAEGYRLLGNMQRSRVLVERSLRVAERIHSPWDTAMALYSVGATYRLLGEWERARVHLEESDRLYRSMEGSWWAIFGILELSTLCLLQGERSRAERLAAEAAQIAQTSGYLGGLRASECLLAQMDLERGLPEAVVWRLEPLCDRPGLIEVEVTAMMPTLAQAYSEVGDHHRAEQTIEEAIRRIRMAGLRQLLAEALVVRGRIRESERRWEDAGRDFDEAVRLCRAMPYPHLEGRALFETGRMLARKGDGAHARQRLTDALGIFERLGAEPYVERTIQALDTLKDS